MEKWDVLPLDGAQAAPLTEGDDAAALLLCSRGRQRDGERWLLLSSEPGRVAVNGMPLHVGIRALSDRDEIAQRGMERVYFSVEKLARVEPCAAAVTDLRCARCRTSVEPGGPAVVCPGCGLIHHETPDKPCWTYVATCASCDQPTALDGCFRWTPEGL